MLVNLTGVVDYLMNSLNHLLDIMVLYIMMHLDLQHLLQKLELRDLEILVVLQARLIVFKQFKD